MSEFPTHVLATLDPEGGDEHVFASAVAMGKAHGARVSALTILPPPLYIQHGLATVEVEFEKSLTEAVESALELKCAKHGLDRDDAHVLRGHPESDIGVFANNKQVDLICVGIHDRHGFEYFLGTVATAALRHADAAIFGHRLGATTGAFTEVVVAIDGDVDSRVVLEKAKQFLAPYPQARVHVVCALRPIVTSIDPDSGAYGEAVQGMSDVWSENLLERIKEMVATTDTPSSSIEVIEGVPSQAIKDKAAEVSADLVIMGTGRHIGFGWHMGSTTNNVMHGTQCSVLAVRPES